MKLAALALGIAALAAGAPVADDGQIARWRRAMEAKLFVPAKPLALEGETHGRFEPEPGVVAERVCYGSQFGMRVPAILYMPAKRAGKIPALIVVNGHGGDKYSWYAFYAGVLYARAGAAVLTYDPLGEGERNPERRSGTRAHDQLERNPELGRRMAGQMITDVMQAVSYLRSRPEIDATRIGAAGYSLGSFVLSISCALDLRLHACVLAGGGNLDGPGEYWDRAKPLCVGFPYQSLDGLGDRPAAIYAMHAARGPTLIYNGLADDVVNVPATGPPFLANLRKRTVALRGTDRGVFETGFVPGASHRPFFVTRPVALWLERTLDLPAWDEAHIRSLPETHVGAWARERGVDVDPLYAPEEREGGTRALGSDVPPLTRVQLSVFRDGEWQASKSRLTIDYWARHVRALRGKPEPVSGAGVLWLVREGTARATIVVGKGASVVERDAAVELSSYILKATRAALPVSMEAPRTPVRVFVGASVCPSGVRLRASRLRPGGFVIETSPEGSVYVAGKDAEGTRFGVYALLEHWGGVRWLWPGPQGEVVPRAASFGIPPTLLVEQPAFAWRDLGPRGPLWGPLDKWQAARELGVSAEHERLESLWERHNRFGGLRIEGGHAFAEVLSPARYGRSHPEYYALVNGRRDSAPEGFDGKHGRQPCTSNPDVIRIMTEHCRGFFAQNPEADAFNISLNDGRGFCECDRCRRLDSGASELERFDPETGKEARYPVITDRIITFANQVAEGVAQQFPYKRLILFAYGQYKQPPVKVKPHANLIVQYTMTAARHWNANAAEKDFSELAAWSRAARHLAVYEYFIQGGFPDMPRLFPELLAPAVRRLHQLGYRYYQTQHGDGYAINGFNYYLLGKLLWNADADPEQVLDDYVERGFGPAAAPVKRYLHRMAAAWHSTGGGLLMDTGSREEYQHVLAAYPSQFREACRRDLDEAGRLVTESERERVRFLQRGLAYVELTAAAVEASLEQGDTAALDAWRERDRYVESLKDDFVIAYLWIRYNDVNRRFHPRRRADSGE